MTSRKQVAILIIAAMCWGIPATASKYALRDFGPLTLLAVELAVATIIIWAVVLVRRWRLAAFSLAPSRRFALLGLLEPGLAYAGLTFGLTHTSAASASLLGGLEGAAVVLLAVTVGREHLQARSTLALLLSLGGVLIICGTGSAASASLGDVLVVAGVLSAASFVLLASRLDSQTNPTVMTAWQFTYGLLFTLPFLVWRWTSGAEAFPTHAPLHAWLGAITAGSIGFAASFLLYNSVVMRVPAIVSGIALNLIPLFGLGAAVAFLHEHVGVAQVGGGLLIIVGIAALPDEPSPEGDVSAGSTAPAPHLVE